MLDAMEPAERPEIIICGLEPNADFEAELAGRDYGVQPENWGAQGAPRLVVLASTPTSALLRLAAENGVHAVLSKNISGEVLQRALDLVMLGQKLFPAPEIDRLDHSEPEHLTSLRPAHPAVARQRPHLRLAVTDTQPHVQLSEREAQILRCLVEGAPNKRIARDLAITEATVKVHIKGLLRKLRVNNRTQAAVWGLNNQYATESRPTPAAVADRLPSLRIAP